MSIKKEMVGATVGRFQVPDLTKAHTQLIEEIAMHPQGVIFVGAAPLIGTRRNPLPPSHVMAMVRAYLRDRSFKHIEVAVLPDLPSDTLWSTQLDLRLQEMFPLRTVRLYSGADGFMTSYNGRYPVTTMPPVVGPHGNEIRNEIRSTLEASPAHRRGIIYATQMIPPAVRVAVDVAITKIDADGPFVALVKKANEDLWRFPGGMPEGSDPDLVYTAEREAKEETSLQISKPQIITTAQIMDWRIAGGLESMFTVLFHAGKLYGSLVPGDDAAQAAWFPISEDLIAQVMPEHQKLVVSFLAYAEERKIYVRPIQQGPDPNYEVG